MPRSGVKPLPFAVIWVKSLSRYLTIKEKQLEKRTRTAISYPTKPVAVLLLKAVHVM